MRLTSYNRKAKAYRFNRAVTIYLNKLGFEKPDIASDQYHNREYGVYVYAEAKDNYAIQSTGLWANTLFHKPVEINGMFAEEVTKVLDFCVKLNEYLALARKEALCTKKK